jgi:hypothetical protein
MMDVIVFAVAALVAAFVAWVRLRDRDTEK